MKIQKQSLRSIAAVCVLSLALVFAGCSTIQGAGGGSTMSHEGHSMAMHHQHQMLNHALTMALQGSNLVMIGQMEMVPGLDELSIDHGNKMIKNGRATWNDMMSGDTMMKMHSAGKSPDSDPTMKYTHELAEAQLKVIDLLEKHASMKGHTMGMHHQHLILNHALEMALEGSDMIMTGQMGMAPGVDSHSADHGKKMIKNARSLWNEVMSGGEMTKMHGEGMAPGSHAGMTFTHELGEAQLKVIDLLEKMPSAM